MHNFEFTEIFQKREIVNSPIWDCKVCFTNEVSNGFLFSLLFLRERIPQFCGQCSSNSSHRNSSSHNTGSSSHEDQKGPQKFTVTAKAFQGGEKTCWKGRLYRSRQKATVRFSYIGEKRFSDFCQWFTNSCK